MEAFPLNSDDQPLSPNFSTTSTKLKAQGPKDAVSKNGALDPIELNTFTHFPELPTELRLKIWNIALPEPRLLVLRSLKEEEAYFEYASKDETFSTVMLGICKESAQVFLRNYTDSAIVFSASAISKQHHKYILPKQLQQHGFIDLERDCLYFDPKTLHDTLADCEATRVMLGLKQAVIRSLDWRSALMLQYDLGESAFPSLTHLAFVLHKTLNENELRYQHFVPAGRPGSTSLSVIHGAQAINSTSMSGTLDFEIA